ncbi:aldehyde-activating protein [Candidatus Endobugula sertula]|uniref:Aldehyde-activating protein n=1 Tax=Candidatus Endobugula sertula TaxID=62101 RepID=A0A1D2QRL4_9GAMM|nr:aldehyde-activating protein [Candidatus Endobugula sertula]
MDNVKNAVGSCLCQSVKVKVEEMSLQVGACHCSMCRKWSGAPALSVDCYSHVTFEGESHISVFNSSEWAERGFCSQCGTHLFYRLKAKNQYIMSVGLFGSHPSFEFDHQIFIDDKPSYYRFANATKNMTGEEVFAAYASDNT